MAAKKELDIPERREQPSVEDYDVSASFRWDTTARFDKDFPNFIHSWKKHGTPQDTLPRQRQEVVKENGKLVEDSMGDFLVRQPKELYDALRKRDADMSLDSAKSVTGGDDRSYWETDLEQERNFKKPKTK